MGTMKYFLSANIKRGRPQMAELHRLVGKGTKGNVTLVLTDTHLTIEPDPDFRAEVEESFAKGKEGAEEAPGVIRWFVGTVLNFASNAVHKLWEPHKIEDVELLITQDKAILKLGLLKMGSELKVNPADAYVFEAHFRRAKEALTTD